MSEAIGTVAIDEGTGLPSPYCGPGISDLAPIPPETGPVKLMAVIETRTGDSGVSQDQLPVLEIKCGRCGGAGGEQRWHDWVKCLHCCGAGHVPTEAGKRILNLIRHNFQRFGDDDAGW